MIKPAPITIVIDTQEQTPWEFPGIPTVRRALRTGDYTLAGYEDRLIIERKSLADLVSTVIYDRENWMDRLYRMREVPLGRAHVIVDATWSDLYAHRYRSEAGPKSVAGLVHRMRRDQPWALWAFAGQEGARLALDIMQAFAREEARADKRWRRAERARTAAEKGSIEGGEK
jgi:hypothetical protein